MKRWQSDEESNFCSQCNDSFTFVKRRHHCRVCGQLFCSDCCSTCVLIPEDKLISDTNHKIDFSIPQRSCNICAQSLQSIQSDLRATFSKANTDNRIGRNSPERYLNLPISYSLENEIKKAAYTLYNCTSDNYIEGKDQIPREFILGASGIAFLTVCKVGFLLSGRMGTGLVVARLNDGSWSAPSAIAMSGLGWGFQMGCELTDVILILNSASAVDAFSSRAQVAVGTELAVSLGPVGRSAGTDIHGGEMGASAAFSYAHSKGLFMGVSLEASVIASRPDINRAFYGMDVKPSILLSSAFPRPKAAEPLYQALSEVLTDVESQPLSSRTRAQYAPHQQSRNEFLYSNQPPKQPQPPHNLVVSDNPSINGYDNNNHNNNNNNTMNNNNHNNNNTMNNNNYNKDVVNNAMKNENNNNNNNNNIPASIIGFHAASLSLSPSSSSSSSSLLATTNGMNNNNQTYSTNMQEMQDLSNSSHMNDKYTFNNNHAKEKTYLSDDDDNDDDDDNYEDIRF